jgi:DMSO/TMAO reductase YedYZ heme-binding membrane subunit
MTPLFITSFMKIRKKMSRKSWVNLQRFAYVVYVLIFIHLLLMASMPNILVYIVLFVPYFILKIIKEVKKYRGNKQQK